MDYSAHNEASRALWHDFYLGRAPRVPVLAGVSSRFILMTPALNPDGYTFRDYMESPEAMLRVQLALERYRRLTLDDDAEKGVPQDGWSVCVDFQNVYEAAWFGAPIRYTDGQVPRCEPILTDASKEAFLKQPLPDPFGGIMGRALTFFSYFEARKNEPLEAGVGLSAVDGCPFWTDGPFTLACLLRGAEAFMMDMADDPDFAKALLMRITDAVIARIRAWRARFGRPVLSGNFGFADDMIQLLSVDSMREFLLPCYLKMHAMLSLPGAGTGLHLCGNAARHMLFLRDVLHLTWLDTGFPMDFERFAKAIGPDVVWQGGPHISLLLEGTPADVQNEVARILPQVMPYTRRFVLRDANDIAPQTPMENVQAMVDAGRALGRF